VALFKSTPAYYGEGAVAQCQPRDRGGFFDWFARLMGFPQTPCYQPADPEETEPPCTTTTPVG